MGRAVYILLCSILFAGIINGASVKWQTKVAYLNPTTDLSTDGYQIFVGSSKGFLISLNKTNGFPIWSTKIGDELPTAPTYVSKSIYICSAEGIIYSIEPSRGVLQWKFDTGDRFWGSSPYLYENILYVGSEQGTVYAINSSSGRLMWQYNAGGAIRANLLIYNGKLYAGSENHNLYALDPKSGKEIWSYEFDAAIWTSAPSAFNDMIFVGVMDNRLYALNASNGRPIKYFKTDGWITATAVPWEGITYFGSHDNKFYSIDANTLQERWHYETGGAVQTTASIHPSSRGSVIYFGSNDGNLYAFRSARGQQLWNLSIGDWIASKPLLDMNKIFFSTYDGDVYSVSDLACHIEYPKENSSTSNDYIEFRGTATARDGVAAVHIKINEGEWRRLNSDTNWSANISLVGVPHGVFEVQCMAENSLGTREERPYNTIRYVRKEYVPPQNMSIDYPKEANKGDLITVQVMDEQGNPLEEATLKIQSTEYVSDEQGIVQFRINKAGKLKISVSCEGYITETISIEIVESMDLMIYLAAIAVLLFIFIILLKLKKLPFLRRE